MDSLTQIVLGAAVGEAVLGKKVGNKAILWGAIAGTIPDLDVVTKLVFDDVTANEMHRGFSHSIIFSILVAPILGFLIAKLYKNKEANWKDWSILMFLGLFTHPILDAFTTWGTQLFWPFDVKVAISSIFVVDPLYTIPFLLFLILAIRYPRTHPKRRKLNKVGLICSSTYLLLTLCLQYGARTHFKNQLQAQQIKYKNIQVRPTPLNTILWTANIETKDAFLIGYRSYLDSTDKITFQSYPKNHQLLNPIKNESLIKRMIHLTEGWYTVEPLKNNSYVFNDLRFGQMGIDKNNQGFVFSYIIEKNTDGTLEAREKEREVKGASPMLKRLFKRIMGN